jgi:hypothetical protein
MAYLAPAVVFVLVFTVYPLGQMVWMSFHNWSLITPPRWVGLGNYQRALADRQYWVSFLFTLKYTAIITPILIAGGYLLALLTVERSPLRRLTRTTVFIPVVIGLGVSSLLWYWLFSADFGLINKALMDLGIISKPVLWLGVDADRSNLAIIASVSWKVMGFGMILFVGAIQAIQERRDLEQALLAVAPEGDIGEDALRHQHFLARHVALHPDFDRDDHGSPPDPLHPRITGHPVADMHGTQERHSLDRHRHHARFRDFRGQDAATQVHECAVVDDRHHPARQHRARHD